MYAFFVLEYVLIRVNALHSLGAAVAWFLGEAWRCSCDEVERAFLGEIDRGRLLNPSRNAALLVRYEHIANTTHYRGEWPMAGGNATTFPS